MTSRTVPSTHAYALTATHATKAKAPPARNTNTTASPRFIGRDGRR